MKRSKASESDFVTQGDIDVTTASEGELFIEAVGAALDCVDDGNDISRCAGEAASEHGIRYRAADIEAEVNVTLDWINAAEDTE